MMRHGRPGTGWGCLVLATICVVLHAQAAIGFDQEMHSPPDYDPWEAYEIISEGDVVNSWEVLRQVNLSSYSLSYETIQGRRRLGLLPTEVIKLMPEAFSTATLLMPRSDGSLSRMEGVPNVDWSNLFSHTLVVTQELSRRNELLEEKLSALKTKRENVHTRLARLTEVLEGEWQSSARLRNLADIAELNCDIIKNKIAFEKVAGEEHHKLLEFKHTKALEAIDMELDVAKMLVEERASLATQTMLEEETGLKDLEIAEESMRQSNENALALLDMEAARQTARLQANSRLTESLTIIHETAAAERGVESARTAIIRARGETAREKMQAVVDETFTLVGTMTSSAVSNPEELVRILALLFGVIFVSLLVRNSVTIAARTITRRVTKSQLVRETDLPKSLPALAIDWVQRSTRATLCPRLGLSRRNLVLPRALKGVILPSDLEQRLCSLASSIRASCARRAPLPNVLLHGAPGSGKSLVARQLAKACGLNIAIVAGGDVGPLGATASSELSGILRWITRAGQRGKRGAGVALIMEEAEAALGDRGKVSMSENARSALTAILLHTGEAQPGFMMILTSSRPQDIDEAVLDRVDEVIRMPTPGLAERKELARQYFARYLNHDVPAAGAITIRDGHTSGLVRLSENFRSEASSLVETLAVKSEGFHGRDMARFFSAVQAAVYSSEDCTLTLSLWVLTERNKLQEFSQKTTMSAHVDTTHAERAIESTSDYDTLENDISTGPSVVRDEEDLEPAVRSDWHPRPSYPEVTRPKKIDISFLGKKISGYIPIRAQTKSASDERCRGLQWARRTPRKALLRANARLLLDKERSEKWTPDVGKSCLYGVMRRLSKLRR